MSNPYKDLQQSELAAAVQRRAGELLNPSGKRTPEERAELAKDTALLLLATAFHVSRGAHTDAPRQVIAGGIVGFKDAFLADYERQKRDLRWRTLSDAMDLALDSGLHFHQQRVVLGGHEAYEAALSTDEGLVEVLALLERKFLAKPRRR